MRSEITKCALSKIYIQRIVTSNNKIKAKRVQRDFVKFKYELRLCLQQRISTKKESNLLRDKYFMVTCSTYNVPKLTLIYGGSEPYFENIP